MIDVDANVSDKAVYPPAAAAALLTQVMGLNLVAEDIAALERRTEGWIAGLQLAALGRPADTSDQTIHALLNPAPVFTIFTNIAILRDLYNGVAPLGGSLVLAPAEAATPV